MSINDGLENKLSHSRICMIQPAYNGSWVKNSFFQCDRLVFFMRYRRFAFDALMSSMGIVKLMNIPIKQFLKMYFAQWNNKM